MTQTFTTSLSLLISLSKPARQTTASLFEQQLPAGVVGVWGLAALTIFLFIEHWSL